MQKNETSTSDREIKISRLLNAPVELVWEVWTNPEHLKNWWGPNGFTNTICPASDDSYLVCKSVYHVVSLMIRVNYEIE